MASSPTFAPLHSRAGVTAPHTLEPNHHRLWFQANIPDFFDTLLNLFFEAENIRGGGSAAIDDGESMFRRNAHVSETESFGKPGVLDQPGRRDFVAAFKGGVAGDVQSSRGSTPL
jgi:hypothetical protein